MKATGTPDRDSACSALATEARARHRRRRPPGFEQVAQDVQRIGGAGLATEEFEELRGDGRTHDVQVQIGDEQGGHAGIVGEQAAARSVFAGGAPDFDAGQQLRALVQVE
jgi:hypothetical protein